MIEVLNNIIKRFKKANNIVKEYEPICIQTDISNTWLDLIIDEKKIRYMLLNVIQDIHEMPHINDRDEKQWNIPMDIFHLLEHLNINYMTNFDEIDISYKNKKNVVILFYQQVCHKSYL